MNLKSSWVPVLALLSLAGCPPAKKTERIEVTPAALALQVGETRAVAGRFLVVEDGTTAPLQGANWSSSDEAVATVAVNTDGSATVTAAGAGSATITVALKAASATVSVLVTERPRTLSRLEVTPMAPSLARGTSAQLTATGIYSDDTREDLTGSVSWASSNGTLATVTPGGRVAGVGVGTVTITAEARGVIGSTSVTVTAATLSRLEVTPPAPTVAQGFTLALTATGVFSDSRTQDLTAQVAWTSSDPTKATVSAAGVVTGLAGGPVVISAAFMGVTGQATVTVGGAALVSIDVTPAAPSLPRGATVQLAATARFSDNTTQDVTTQATWTSSSPGTATVTTDGTTRGLVSARAQGAATITAALATKSGSTVVNVTAATLTRIEVTPMAGTVAKGLTQQLAATGVYSDGSTADFTALATWSSSDTAIASVSNAQGSYGLARGVSVGQATLSATRGGVTGTATLDVTAAELVRLAVAPAMTSVAKGLTTTITATGTFTDGSTADVSTQVTWSSTVTSVATVSNAAGSQGVVTALSTGATTIRATTTLSGGMSTTATATVTVTPAQLVSLAVTPSTATVAKGGTQQFVATGTYTDTTTQVLTNSATWASGTPATATVTTSGAARGLVTAVAEGASVITATSGTVSASATVTVTAAALASITVTPEAPSVAKGLAQAFTATGVYTDATTAPLTGQVTWASSDVGVATISNAAGTQGTATTLATGTTTLSATLGAVSGSTTLTVTPAALVSIAVTGASTTVRRGDTTQLAATGTYTDGTTQVLTGSATWTSAATGTATVNDATSKGLVTGVAVGAASIGATVGTVTGSATVTVTPPDLVSLAVTPAVAALSVGQTQAFVATGTYSDATTQVLTATATWSSSATGVATVSNAAGTEGLASAVGAGSATLTATSGGITGSASLTVTSVAVASIAVTPASPSLVEGLTQQFTATATYTDTTTGDVTAVVTWASSDPSKATLSSGGLATGVAAGTTSVTATLGGVTGAQVLTVTAPVITSIAVTPASPSVAKGRTQAFTATATRNNNTTADVSASATWTSSDPVKATISSTGVATALAEGTSDITASVGGVTSPAAVLTVTPAELLSIALTGLPATFRKGDTASLVATGTYTDTSTQVLTGTATWASSAPAVATVSDTAGTKGQLAGVTAGAATLTATVGTVVGTLAVTVAPPDLVSIAVTPATASVLVGGTTPLTATGTYSDSSTQSLGSTATWASGAATVATVSTAGLVTGVSAGTATISATVGSVSGSATVTVSNPPPSVTAVSPADAATGVSGLALVAVTFDRAMDPASLTVQSATGACSGSIQVSRNDFSTCIGLGAPSFNAANTTATVVPAPAFADGAGYKVRVTTAAQSSLGVALASAFAQATGFTIRGGAPCGTNVVISQVYGGGGGTTAGPTYVSDYVELHNPTLAPINVGGWAVQYTSATGPGSSGTGQWSIVGSIPAGTIIPAGGFLLIRGGTGTAGAALPVTPDVTSSVGMSATTGKVALTNTVTALLDSVPNSTAIVDRLSYGPTATNAETAPMAALTSTTGAWRRNGGCGDNNNNSTDFDILPPLPRNSASTPVLCECSLNELAVATPNGEIDFCNTQSPSTLAALVSATTATTYGRLYEAGVTEAGGAPAGLVAQFGFGSPQVNPQTQPGWSWFTGAYNVQVGNDDEYQYVFTAPAQAGTYRYGVRFSFDGLNWTYCDLDGAGSNANLSFDPADLGVMTVTVP